MATNDERPVQDEGVPYRRVPYRAGGPQGELSTRKNALLSAGPGTGYVPGHPGSDYHSSAQAGYVHEAPLRPVDDDDELEAARRPMPRQIPVHSYPAHMGTITRYLDGHSEIHRERPGLVNELNNPHLHDDDREDIRAEIAHRDAIHKHTWW